MFAYLFCIVIEKTYDIFNLILLQTSIQRDVINIDRPKERPQFLITVQFVRELLQADPQSFDGCLTIQMDEKGIDIFTIRNGSGLKFQPVSKSLNILP